MVNPVMSANFDWFKKHYPEFQKEYGDCWLAIKGCSVVGVYGSYQAAHEAMSGEQIGTYNIQDVAKDYITYRHHAL